MKDFCDFRFGNVNSEDLHLLVTSTSDRYEKNVLPENQDYTEDIPGGDGSYYFGSVFKNREFQVDVAFDNVDEKTWRCISNLFATDKLQDLVFDELPYKTYRAKIKSNPYFGRKNLLADFLDFFHPFSSVLTLLFSKIPNRITSNKLADR